MQKESRRRRQQRDKRDNHQRQVDAESELPDMRYQDGEIHKMSTGQPRANPKVVNGNYGFGNYYWTAIPLTIQDITTQFSRLFCPEEFLRQSVLLLQRTLTTFHQTAITGLSWIQCILKGNEIPSTIAEKKDTRNRKGKTVTREKRNRDHHIAPKRAPTTIRS